MGRHKNPCPLCAHWHTHSRPCDLKTEDCQCPGTKAWYDWAVVYWVMKGELTKDESERRVTRPLTELEKKDVVRRIMAQGGGFQEVENITNLGWRTIKRLMAEIRNESTAVHSSSLAAV